MCSNPPYLVQLPGEDGAVKAAVQCEDEEVDVSRARGFVRARDLVGVVPGCRGTLRGFSGTHSRCSVGHGVQWDTVFSGTR